MGIVEGGITAMKWSPDQELLVITTATETLILMTREYDLITEVQLHTEQFGEGGIVFLSMNHFYL